MKDYLIGLSIGLGTGIIFCLYAYQVGHKQGYEKGYSKYEEKDYIANKCIAWWFEDSKQRINDAKKFICR